ncbi:MAG: nucleotide pyrophosphohydrolase [Saprospiraceae bacterium]|jgi:NTP pyrophosphatase (non-canonical NTP hydrolase)|nr:nucleotide pyrophosphohydrolase [Saprospiraceae bacterium]
MNFSDYQKKVDHWIQTIGVRYFAETTNALILSEEVGEVSRLISRMYGEQSFRQPVSPDEQKEMLADELADVLWVVVCLANQTGINLEDAIHANFNKKNQRDFSRHQDNPKLHSS